MAKVNPNKPIQKRRTEQEMRNALTDWRTGNAQHFHVPSEMDDTDIILQDCIEELLEARQMLEEMRGFVSVWYARFTRK